jgi:hypothetical protein
VQRGGIQNHKPGAFAAVEAYRHALCNQVANGDGVRPALRIEGHDAKHRERISVPVDARLATLGIRLEGAPLVSVTFGRMDMWSERAQISRAQNTGGLTCPLIETTSRGFTSTFGSV